MDEQAPFRTFLLEHPYRLVIDLPSFNWNAEIVDETKQTAGILDIRHGKLQDGYARIVLDLKSPALIKSAFNIDKKGENNNKIVIDYTNTNENTFKTQKNKVFGTLSPEKAQSDTQTTPKYIFNGAKELNPDTSTPELTNEEENSTTNSINTPQSDANEYKPIIVIDAGHGGADPGAIGANDTFEKNVVLALSKELQKILLNTGRYRVILTREKDIFIKLKDRVQFARDHNADLFISIHADSTPHKDTKGTSIYTLSQKASDEQTEKLAEQENRADLIGGINLGTEDEQVAYILGDFLMTDTMNQSKFLANTLVKKMKSSKINLLQQPHRYAGFAVLKAPDIPSVLIEAGFMSNKTEANLLNQAEHRKKIAKSILSGINAYFEQVQNNE